MQAANESIVFNVLAIEACAMLRALPRPPRAPHDPDPDEDLPEGDPPDEDETDDPDDEDEGEEVQPPLYGVASARR